MNSKKKLPAVALIGPTGIGKTELSLAIAEKTSAEIISVDSMQVYRFMDIGTAKATKEERKRIKHHLIDIVDPDEDYNAGRFVDDALTACNEIISRGKLPFFVGGTGLYLKSLLEGLFDITPVDLKIKNSIRKELEEKGEKELYLELCKIDKETASRVHPNDIYRITRALEIFRSTGTPWSEFIKAQTNSRFSGILKIGLYRDRDELYKRINLRVGEMIKTGLLSEVKWLLSNGYGPHLKSMQSIGYRHMVNYIEKTWNWDDTLDLLARDTRRYAKRQLTWFKRDQEIQWFHPDDSSAIDEIIDNYLD